MKLPKDSIRLLTNINTSKHLNPLPSELIYQSSNSENSLSFPIYFKDKNVWQITLRLFKENYFVVSYNNRLHTPEFLAQMILKNAPKLIKRQQKIPQEKLKFLNLKENEFALFDEIHTFKVIDNKLIIDDKKIISIVRKNTNIRAVLDKYIANQLLMYLTKRQSELEAIMNTPAYKIKLMNANTLWGKNWFNRREIAYSFNLSKQKIAFIDATIIHELAHHFHQNHSTKFWNVVLKYCPEYKEIKKYATL
ncbi:Protein of uncharacterised function DUF45 [Mycoplasmopsis californica]|uniref:M48 family metallopeptidase n=1 Tax=Mycoplasmopsis equigenitalium TaxID=114883 RepID=A0ABY5J672_9BACT|nr:YgjP-like metallopeptidase domain-containing protein [Mycoplasmopsis equigenitalium]UUD37178.1 M48 family metallopeptidase [Mycoplasmopsis equigenitalium]VEU69516.1 Protein of uncharacterised function DUF45 [Mycoplasmopsis californica]